MGICYTITTLASRARTSCAGHFTLILVFFSAVAFQSRVNPNASITLEGIHISTQAQAACRRAEHWAPRYDTEEAALLCSP